MSETNTQPPWPERDVWQAFPDGQPLTFSIPCLKDRELSKSITSSASVSAPTHDVTLHPDWTIAAPHDFETERLATALGGYCSCLDLCDRLAPILTQIVEAQTRINTPEIVRHSNKKWSINAEHFDRKETYFFLDDAAFETRNYAHFSSLSGCPVWLIRHVTHALESAWGSWSQPPTVLPGLASLVRDEQHLSLLWFYNIHPSELPALADGIEVVDGPLDPTCYANLKYGNTPGEWLREVLAYRPTTQVLRWLTTLDGKLPAAAVGRWLSFDLDLVSIDLLLQKKDIFEETYFLAAMTDLQLESICRIYASALGAELHLWPSHFSFLAENGVDTPDFDAPTITRVHAEVGPDLPSPWKFKAPRPAPPLSKASVAVMLAVDWPPDQLIKAIVAGLRECITFADYQTAESD